MLKIKRFLEYRKCSVCGEEYISTSINKINKNDYICRNCATSHDYYTKNNIYKGNKTQMSFSFEFETSSKAKELYELLKYKFIGCSDCTINGLEWKSPIFYNRKSFHTICRKLNKFAKYVGTSCGTHLHVSTLYKDRIREYEVQLFTPILNVMIQDRDATEKFWGRYFGHYCRAGIEDDRYNSFNTRSSVDTLEFRLLKFKSARQYIRACDFCIDTTRYINTFIGRETFDNNKALKMGEIIAEKYKEVIKSV